MRLIRLLLLAGLRSGRIRPLLSVISVAAATALVLCVAGAYHIPPEESPPDPMGPYDFVVRSGSYEDWEADEQRYGMIPPRPALHEPLLDEVRRDARVERAVETGCAKVELFKPGGMFRGPMYHPLETAPRIMVACADDRCPPGVSVSNWDECMAGGKLIVNENVLTQYGLDVGDTLIVASGGGRCEFPIGATFRTPGSGKRAKTEGRQKGFFPDQGVLKDFGGVLVSRAAFEQITAEPFRVNRVFVILADEPAAEGFRADLERSAEEHQGLVPVCILGADDYLAHRRGVRLGGGFGVLPHMATVLVCLAAFYVLLSSLCIGVQSRRRQMAVLRALGAGRARIVSLVFAEAMLLATVGFLAGIPLGWFLLTRGVTASAADLATAASAVLPMAAAIVCGSTLVAALPAAAIAASRHPLESVDESALAPAPGSPPPWLLPASILLLAINPLVSFVPGLPLEMRTFLAPLSYIPAVTGLVLLAPWAIRLTEWLFYVPLARMLRLRGELLEGQLTSQFWRATAGASAMMIGLGLFVTVHVWGLSMQTPFLVGQRSPDAVAVVFPKGLTEAGVERISRLNGVARCIPLFLQHPTISDEAVAVTNSTKGWRDLIYIGGDARSILDPDDGMISAHFVRGNAEEAISQVERQGACLITEELYHLAPHRFDVGCDLEIQTVDGTRTLSREIAGVVRVPGWHLLTKSARMRRGLGHVASMVFVASETAGADFPGSFPRAFLLELEEKVPREANRETVRAAGQGGRDEGPRDPAAIRGDRFGGGTPPRDPNSLEASVETLARMHSPDGASAMETYVRVTNTQAMTQAIRNRCEGIIARMSRVPLIALGLSALAVTATLAASVRARRRELGVLRCIGLSRLQLFRLISAEGLLTGLVACILGGLFGVTAAWTGIEVSSLGWGVTSPFLIPWGTLALGALIALATGLTGALIPAAWASMRGPLELFESRKEP